MRIQHLVWPLVLLGVAAGSQTATAQNITANSIKLSWTTPGDDSLSGTAAQFDLRYATFSITSANFASATSWNGTPTPTAPGTRQSATVTGLQPSTQYWFAIKTGDDVPNWSGVSNIITGTTLAAPDTIRPAAIANLAIISTTEISAALRWNATGDDSLTGTATSYDVRYSTSPITAANWASATQATGEPAPGSSGTVQNFTVNGLTRQTTYYFAVKVADEAGNPSDLSNVASASTPDLTRPASINDLVVGFVWLNASATYRRLVRLDRPTFVRHRI